MKIKYIILIIVSIVITSYTINYCIEMNNSLKEHGIELFENQDDLSYQQLVDKREVQKLLFTIINGVIGLLIALFILVKISKNILDDEPKN